MLVKFIQFELKTFFKEQSAFPNKEYTIIFEGYSEKVFTLKYSNITKQYCGTLAGPYTIHEQFFSINKKYITKYVMDLLKKNLGKPQSQLSFH